jgi:hypothetical protein
MELLLFLGIIVAIVAFRIAKAWHKQALPEMRTTPDPQAVRLKACEDVLSFFADQLGYEARLAVSREELWKRIDAGAAPDELVALIHERRAALPGIELGTHTGGPIPWTVKLPDAIRERHVYVVGKSGYGKTNLLRNMILQDLEAGHGVGVVAPEQEMLLEEIIPFIPESRTNDVIYFNPSDTERPVCLNPLELDAGEDLDVKVDETCTILSRILGEGGPRMDEILRHTLYALTEIQGTTLLDIERLLDRSNAGFRNDVLGRLKDDRTIEFFHSVYPQMPKDAHLPIVNRIGRLVRAKIVRGCLCQPKGTLSIRDAMDQGRILLFNLSDGILGEAASQLLGQLIVSKFQLATMSRADTAKHERKPFYLYIDEFQAFVGEAASSYTKILSRARKYRLGLVLAHQQTGQIPLEVLKEVFGNVSTLVSFQVSQSDAQKLAREFVTEVDGEIIGLDSGELLRLRVGEAWCKIGQNAFPMQTEKFDLAPDNDRLRAVIERSRQRWGVALERGSRSPTPDDGLSKSRGEHPSLDDLDPEQVF